MRHAVLLTIGLLVPAVASAVPVACPGAANNTGALVLVDFNTLFPDGCYQQDKLYQNFTTDAPPDTSVTIAFQQPTGFDRHTVTFSGNFDASNGPFTIDYDVSIFGLTTLRMTRITADILLPALGSETLAKSVTDTATGFAYAAIVAMGNSGAAIDIAPTTALHISETYDPNGGAATGIANGIIQTQPIPEPATLLLLGSSLTGAALFRRRRRS